MKVTRETHSKVELLLKGKTFSQWLFLISVKTPCIYQSIATVHPVIKTLHLTEERWIYILLRCLLFSLIVHRLIWWQGIKLGSWKIINLHGQDLRQIFFFEDCRGRWVKLTCLLWLGIVGIFVISFDRRESSLFFPVNRFIDRLTNF